MIPTFETQTEPLNEKEKIATRFIAKKIKRNVGKNNRVTSDSLVLAVFRKYQIRLTDARIRKIIRHIRLNNLVPRLIATNKGYYVCDNAEEYSKFLKSLATRVQAITDLHNAMHAQGQELVNPNNK